MQIPVIIVSGFITDEVSEDLKKLDVEAFVQKPFRAADIIAHVKRVIGSAQEATEQPGSAEKPEPENVGPASMTAFLASPDSDGKPVETKPPASPDQADVLAALTKLDKGSNPAPSRARRTQFGFGIKPHVNNAVYNTETALRMMGEVDREWIGINYDPTHIWRTPQEEVPEETLDPLLNHMFSIRIRDVKTRQLKICPVAQQVAGEGDLNLAALSSKLKTAPHVTHAVLEIVGTKEMPIDEIDPVVQRSFDAFEPLFA